MNEKTISVGDYVRGIGSSAGFVGIVTAIVPGVSIEDHGHIEVDIIRWDPKRYKWFSPGQINSESWVHWEWWRSMEVIAPCLEPTPESQ